MAYFPDRIQGLVDLIDDEQECELIDADKTLQADQESNNLEAILSQTESSFHSQDNSLVLQSLYQMKAFFGDKDYQLSQRDVDRANTLLPRLVELLTHSESLEVERLVVNLFINITFQSDKSCAILSNNLNFVPLLIKLIDKRVDLLFASLSKQSSHAMRHCNMQIPAAGFTLRSMFENRLLSVINVALWLLAHFQDTPDDMQIANNDMICMSLMHNLIKRILAYTHNRPYIISTEKDAETPNNNLDELGTKYTRWIASQISWIVWKDVKAQINASNGLTRHYIEQCVECVHDLLLVMMPYNKINDESDQNVQQVDSLHSHPKLKKLTAIVGVDNGEASASELLRSLAWILKILIKHDMKTSEIACTQLIQTKKNMYSHTILCIMLQFWDDRLSSMFEDVRKASTDLIQTRSGKSGSSDVSTVKSSPTDEKGGFIETLGSSLSIMSGIESESNPDQVETNMIFHSNMLPVFAHFFDLVVENAQLVLQSFNIKFASERNGVLHQIYQRLFDMFWVMSNIVCVNDTFIGEFVGSNGLGREATNGALKIMKCCKDNARYSSYEKEYGWDWKKECLFFMLNIFNSVQSVQLLKRMFVKLEQTDDVPSVAIGEQILSILVHYLHKFNDWMQEIHHDFVVDILDVIKSLLQRLVDDQEINILKIFMSLDGTKELYKLRNSADRLDKYSESAASILDLFWKGFQTNNGVIIFDTLVSLDCDDLQQCGNDICALIAKFSDGYVKECMECGEEEYALTMDDLEDEMGTNAWEDGWFHKDCREYCEYCENWVQQGDGFFNGDAFLCTECNGCSSEVGCDICGSFGHNDSMGFCDKCECRFCYDDGNCGEMCDTCCVLLCNRCFKERTCTQSNGESCGK